jgi:hypothetical protein
MIIYGTGTLINFKNTLRFYENMKKKMEKMTAAGAGAAKNCLSPKNWF